MHFNASAPAFAAASANAIELLGSDTINDDRVFNKFRK